MRLAERPDHAVRWFRDRFIKKGNPLGSGLPWISWKAIDFFRRMDLRDKVVYEYGGGGSTIFFASRGARVITLETHAKWTSMIMDDAKRRGLAERIDVVTFEIDSAESKARYLDHIRTIASWDVALIDGCDTDYRGGCKHPITRMECVPSVVETARAGCLVVVDDAWRPTYAKAPGMLAPGKRRIFRGLGPHRPGVTQTDVYTF